MQLLHLQGCKQAQRLSQNLNIQVGCLSVVVIEDIGQVYRHFYPVIETAPDECATIKMDVDDVNDYFESFQAYLNDGEDIASFVMTAEDGITVNSSSLYPVCTN